MESILFYVYNLRCCDGFYVGCTNNLNERIKRYQAGLVEATKKTSAG